MVREVRAEPLLQVAAVSLNGFCPVLTRLQFARIRFRGECPTHSPPCRHDVHVPSPLALDAGWSRPSDPFFFSRGVWVLCLPRHHPRLSGTFLRSDSADRTAAQPSGTGSNLCAPITAQCIAHAVVPCFLFVSFVPEVASRESAH